MQTPPHFSFSKALMENFFSYLFHELISPLSSIVTGLDLLEEGVEGEDVMEILHDAAGSLRGRLEFFRAALGAGGSMLTLAQTQKYLAQFWLPQSAPSVLFETDAQVLPQGAGQQILRLSLWLSHIRAFGTEPARLVYSKDLFVAHVNGKRLNEASIQKALLQWPETLDPKKSLAPFLGHMLMSS